MTDEQIDQAIEQLRRRCEELVSAGLAPAAELARDIDQLHVVWLARYTVRPAGNSAVGAFGREVHEWQ